MCVHTGDVEGALGTVGTAGTAEEPLSLLVLSTRVLYNTLALDFITRRMCTHIHTGPIHIHFTIIHVKNKLI